VVEYSQVRHKGTPRFDTDRAFTHFPDSAAAPARRRGKPAVDEK
jgi:hypothetical protein